MGWAKYDEDNRDIMDERMFLKEKSFDGYYGNYTYTTHNSVYSYNYRDDRYEKGYTYKKSTK